MNGGLGSAPATVLFVPMPRMVTRGGSPGVLRDRDRRHHARKAFDRLHSQLLEGPCRKHRIAMGVDWTSAAPVFVAVTVTLSASEDTASTTLSVAVVAPTSIWVLDGSNPLNAAVTR